MSTFTITASPGTDIWRKPPSTDIFNAPFQSPDTSTTTGPLQSFLSGRVSFLLPAKVQYDQAGLLLTFRHTGSSSSSSSPVSPRKWIKTGVEFYEGEPRIGTVATERYADWSLSPVTGGGDNKWVTVEINRGRDEHGISLWVYQVLEGGEKVPLREVCWVFGDEPEKWELSVAAFAARPGKDVSEGLEVQFRDFAVEWTK